MPKLHAIDYKSQYSDHRISVEMEKACYWLKHINIVDQLFIARLQGEPEEFDDVVIEQRQDIRQLEEAFTRANQWFLDFCLIRHG
ncbi:hypothetical protein [Pseudomonas brassicacearum]|uniref:hypothetical protein n=1 Tax=Pseudomonas brassicacearum TaxID=930166 RepID=UPI001BDF5279|nr:hypothetical protein [Pseudomonas brassicacearum]